MSLLTQAKELEGRFGGTFDHQLGARYNIAPGDDFDVVPNRDPEHAARMDWGIVPHQVDDPDDWPKPMNAWAETVAEKSAFRGAFEKCRCLVLADGFYEWAGSRGSKTPYRIHRSDDEPFAFAGLWETGDDNGDELETVTIITTDANDIVEPIHDRMLVMLEPDEEARWLEEDDPDELQALLDPYLDGLTDAYEISTRVSDPGNDSPELIEPVGHDQSGLE